MTNAKRSAPRSRKVRDRDHKEALDIFKSFTDIFKKVRARSSKSVTKIKKDYHDLKNHLNQKGHSR